MSDSTLGVRYQIFNEADADSPWIPTLTFRAGAVVPGTYDRHVGFAPGNHGVAIEPSILFRKHVGWEGFGVWGDILYRWEHTIGADQYIGAVGLFQQIKGWELDVGYRHLQTISGEDIVLGPPTGSGTVIPSTRASVTPRPGGISDTDFTLAKPSTAVTPTRLSGWGPTSTSRSISSRAGSSPRSGKAADGCD
jgi:hypothetical protein